MSAVVTGWWKRRYLPRSRRVEYHFLREESDGFSECGLPIGEKRPVMDPGPWTRMPSAVARKFACAECVRRLS